GAIFGRLKDLGRFATRYDTLAHNVISAVARAALFALWI
ncbi:MAG: IS5/IS1182 family transposase, partial [Pseudomonadota bacterium]